MSQLTLEDRVSVLEKQVGQLLKGANPSKTKDWRQAVGMFAGNDFMKQLDEEGRKIREADRRKGRRSLKRRTGR